MCTYTLDSLAPNLCFQGVYFFENFEIVAIDSYKNNFLTAMLIKLTLDNIFIKVKKIRGGKKFISVQTATVVQIF